MVFMLLIERPHINYASCTLFDNVVLYLNGRMYYVTYLVYTVIYDTADVRFVENSQDDDQDSEGNEDNQSDDQPRPLSFSRWLY